MYLSGSANCKCKGFVQSKWDIHLFGCNTTRQISFLYQISLLCLVVCSCFQLFNAAYTANWFPRHPINGCCRPPHPHSFSMQPTLTTVYCWLILVVYSVPVSKTYPSNQAITEREIGCISFFQSTTVNRLMTSVREWNWQSEVPVNVIIVVKKNFGGEIVGFCGFQENVFLYPTEGPFPSACRLH